MLNGVLKREFHSPTCANQGMHINLDFLLLLRKIKSDDVATETVSPHNGAAAKDWLLQWDMCFRVLPICSSSQSPGNPIPAWPWRHRVAIPTVM